MLRTNGSDIMEEPMEGDSEKARRTNQFYAFGSRIYDPDQNRS